MQGLLAQRDMQLLQLKKQLMSANALIEQQALHTPPLGGRSSRPASPSPLPSPSLHVNDTLTGRDQSPPAHGWGGGEGPRLPGSLGHQSDSNAGGGPAAATASSQLCSPDRRSGQVVRGDRLTEPPRLPDLPSALGTSGARRYHALASAPPARLYSPPKTLQQQVMAMMAQQQLGSHERGAGAGGAASTVQGLQAKLLALSASYKQVAQGWKQPS